MEDKRFILNCYKLYSLHIEMKKSKKKKFNFCQALDPESQNRFFNNNAGTKRERVTHVT